MFKNLMIKDFEDKLSSDEPTPGGGASAALSASTAMSLCAMVFNLTINKKAFKQYDKNTQDSILKSLNEANTYKDEFLEFMDRDAEAFTELMSVFGLPKYTDEQIKIRKLKLQKGYKTALKIPLDLAKKSIEAYGCILNSAEYGSKNVISDAGVAAFELHCAVESALLNVKINLAYILDKKYTDEVESVCRGISENNLKYKNVIIEKVNSKILS